MAMPAALQAAPLLYDPVQLLGTVARLGEGRRCTVHCDGKDWEVERAASCLLAPNVGDEVLISGPVPDRVYLIAVIRQAADATARLEVEGDVQFTSIHGAISLHAARGLALDCSEDMSLSSDTLALRAQAAQLSMGQLEYLGREANVAVGKMSWVGTLCEMAVDRLTQVAHSVFRLVRDTDQVRAGRLDYEAGQVARVHGGHAMVTARHVVKVDADQIHMG